MTVQPVTYRAAWVLPINQPPQRGGWVTVQGDRVLSVSGKGRMPTDFPVIDLGARALLPGLINAHTHLEFSHLRKPLGLPGIRFEDWLLEVIRNREQSMADRTAAVRRGLEEARLAGTRLLCEIATLPWEEVTENPPTELVVFGEVLGLSEARAADRLAQAAAHVNRFFESQRLTVGLSPHAPYSTSLQVEQQAVELAKRVGAGVAMHVAENPSERELLEHGRGPLADCLRELGVFRAELFGGGTSTILERLKVLAGAPYGLVVHGHDLRAAEFEFIRQHPNLTLVYCPRTQAFFRHEPRGFEQLLRQGARIALGTDSRASNPDLSIWNELRWLWTHRPDVDWQVVLRMATSDGADAVARPDLGRIEPGACCGVISVDGSADRVDDLVATWLVDESPVWLPGVAAHG